MYKTEQPKIAQLASESENGYRAAVLFAITSANMHFAELQQAMEDIKENGNRSIWLYGSKIKGYDILWDDTPFIHETIALWQTNPKHYARGALKYFLQYPGLGLVKAGFVVHMLLGEIGCLDTHNAIHFNIPAKVYRARQIYTESTIDRYIETCNKCGTTEQL